MPRGFQLLLLSAIALSFTLPAQAAETNPKGLNQNPEPGWSVWRPKNEIAAAGFSSGFSNSEAGGFLDFEQACSEAIGTPKDETPYWFRLSNSIDQIGTGKVEFGCWKKGALINTIVNTAISTKLENVTCLRVRVPTGEDLRIRAEPSLKAKIIGAVKNGATVRPDSFPATIVQANQRNWVAILAPRQGWVSNDRSEASGNLTLCNPHSALPTGTKGLNPLNTASRSDGKQNRKTGESIGDRRLD
nr:SH3 domain-containing protein [Stenomitos rutilans HA7619-LM2]